MNDPWGRSWCCVVPYQRLVPFEFGWIADELEVRQRFISLATKARSIHV